MKPPIITWMMVLCFGVAIFSFAAFMFFTLAGAQAQPFSSSPTEFFRINACYSLFTLGPCLFYAVVPVLPRRPWAWYLIVTAITLTFPTICLLLGAIPILVGFLRPEVRAWYGVTT